MVSTEWICYSLSWEGRTLACSLPLCENKVEEEALIWTTEAGAKNGRRPWGPDNNESDEEEEEGMLADADYWPDRRPEGFGLVPSWTKINSTVSTVFRRLRGRAEKQSHLRKNKNLWKLNMLRKIKSFYVKCGLKILNFCLRSEIFEVLDV